MLWAAIQFLHAAAAVGIGEPGGSEVRARAIDAAVAGAQLFARGRSDIALFDATIASYRAVGLLPV
ncbi:hypothetical protein ASE90_15720 [Sphingomonas sp. Leaf67]|nr:hypothetical protein ASE91_08910 [Sphingomonas sp. Leaf62]KQN79785.1 hypothetical protein ASE90_15720 [Sphingomonas sp. Leaf67]